jgi:hypothetical protein
MPFSDFQGLLDIGTYRFGVVRLSVYLDIFDVSKNKALEREDYIKILLQNIMYIN